MVTLTMTDALSNHASKLVYRLAYNISELMVSTSGIYFLFLFPDPQQHLSVDLDSVYMSSHGTPVYKLSTVDADRRNRFRLVVTVFFIDGKGSRSFVSPTFLLRSRRPERKKSY